MFGPRRNYLLIHRDPDAGGSGGGGAPDASTSQATPNTSGTADGSDSGASSQSGSSSSDGDGELVEVQLDESYFHELDKKMTSGQSLTAEEDEALESWLENGGAGPLTVKRKKASLAQSKKEGSDDTPAQPSLDSFKDKPFAKHFEGLKALQIPDNIAPEIAEAMELVGAKDLTELKSKTQALRQEIAEKGGKAGQRIKQLESSFEKMQTVITKAFSGDQDALAFVKDKFGIVPAFGTASGQGGQATSQPNAQSQSVGGMQDYLLSQDDINASVDPELAARFNNNLQKMASAFENQLNVLTNKLAQSEKVYEKLTAQKESEVANGQIVEELLGLAQEFSDVYTPNAETRRMLEEYSRGGVVHPSIQPLLDTVKHMLENGIPNVKLAHKDLHWGKATDQTAAVLKAKEEQRKKLLYPTKTIGHTGTATGGIKPQYTEAQINGILNGSVAAPDEWFDDNGIVLDNVPPEIRAKVMASMR